MKQRRSVTYYSHNVLDNEALYVSRWSGGASVHHTHGTRWNIIGFRECDEHSHHQITCWHITLHCPTRCVSCEQNITPIVLKHNGASDIFLLSRELPSGLPINSINLNSNGNHYRYLMFFSCALWNIICMYYSALNKTILIFELLYTDCARTLNMYQLELMLISSHIFKGLNHLPDHNATPP